MTSGPGDEGHRGYGGDHVEIHGTFHDKVIGKIGTYIENYHPPAEQERWPQIVEGDIPRQPPGFQPRAELVGHLAERVAAEGAAVVCALTGTPGVGKSVLAASYAWACQAARWPVVAWIAAESEEQILTGLAGLAERLKMRGPDDDAHTAANRAKHWLAAADRPCLVIFDNAADPALIRRWCPATGAARVVITSRNATFNRIYAPVEVAAFTLDEARQLLSERTGLTGQADRADADRLAVELGRLPLALSQAAAVIAQRRIGYGDYLNLLRDFPLADYLPAQAGEDYPAGTAQTMLLAIQQAESAIEEAGLVLGGLAVLSAAGIPRYLLYPTPAPDIRLEVDRAGRARMDRVLADLADTSLITFTADGSTIVMHRLVQRVVCERAHHDGHLNTLIDYAADLLTKLNATVPPGVTPWSARLTVEILQEQITALYGHAPHSAVLLAMRSQCGQYLHHLADLPRTIEVLSHVLKNCEWALDANHSDTLLRRNNLTKFYEAIDRVEKLIAFFEATLADCEQALGVDHHSTLSSRNNLAYAYQWVGRMAEATALFEATLADCERVLGVDDPATLMSRSSLAGAYRAAGRTAEAIALYETVLAEEERVLGVDASSTLFSRLCLGGAYRTAGRVTEAILFHEAVLADCERVLGVDHPFTLGSRDALAHTYESAGRVGEAIGMFEAMLADHERVLGVNHPDTMANRKKLASSYEAVGRVAEAIVLHEAVLVEEKRVLGVDHPTTLTSRNNLASAYQREGRVAEAIALSEVILTEHGLAVDAPSALVARAKLACTYEAAGQIAEAVVSYEAVLADCERVLGVDHPTIRMVRNNMRRFVQP